MELKPSIYFWQLSSTSSKVLLDSIPIDISDFQSWPIDKSIWLGKEDEFVPQEEMEKETIAIRQVRKVAKNLLQVTVKSSNSSVVAAKVATKPKNKKKAKKGASVIKLTAPIDYAYDEYISKYTNEEIIIEQQDIDNRKNIKEFEIEGQTFENLLKIFD